MKQTFVFRVAIVALLAWVAYTQTQILRFTQRRYFPVSVEGDVSLAGPVRVTREVDANVTNAVEVSGDVNATVLNSPLEIESEVQIVR